MLHLLLEDLKLNKLMSVIDTNRLARMLVKLALAIDPHRKAAYIEYYIKEHSNVITKDEAEKSISGKMLRDGVDIEAAPKVLKWIEDLMKGNVTQVGFVKMPLFFERTRKLVRIYEIMCGSSQPQSYVHPALIVNKGQKMIDYSSLD